MLIGETLLNTTVEALKSKSSNIEKIEYKNLIIFEKDNPFYNSKIFNIKLKYYIACLALITIARSK